MVAIDNLKLDHLVGREVGTAVLLKELARGGMGAVFVAFQKTLKRQIAVKILPKSLLTSAGAELFQQEAESAAILSHPNIVPIYEVGETEDFLFFTMQLIQGVSLAHLIHRNQKHLLPSRRLFPVKEALKILIGVLDALAYAHRHDIIHRDIKPANVMIETHTRRPIITDFGIAKVLRGPDVNVPKILGTPVYMAPEQITGGGVDGRADMYAAGVMLFEMLTPYLPIPASKTTKDLVKMKVMLRDDLFQKKPSELNRLIDTDLDAIILKSLAYEPEKRYVSCRELINALEKYRALHPTQGPS